MFDVNLLENFTGTEAYHKHWAKQIVLTDGVYYLQNNGAGWLIDVIASAQLVRKVRNCKVQLWELKVTDKKGIVEMREDIGQPAIYSQELEYTDFPLSEFKLYLIDKVLLLPSEY